MAFCLKKNCVLDSRHLSKNFSLAKLPRNILRWVAISAPLYKLLSQKDCLVDDGEKLANDAVASISHLNVHYSLLNIPLQETYCRSRALKQKVKDIQTRSVILDKSPANKTFDININDYFRFFIQEPDNSIFFNKYESASLTKYNLLGPSSLSFDMKLFADDNVQFFTCSEMNNCKANNKLQDDVTNYNKRGLPDPMQLQHVHDVLVRSLTQLFTHNLDLSIYDERIIFENRIRGTRTYGLKRYAIQMTILKYIGCIKFRDVRFHILKITQHPEEGVIKIRWRISGYSFFGTILQKIKIFRNSSYSEGVTLDTWYDGFSTFYVNSNGKVIRHVADNRMTDEGRLQVKQPISQLAILFGFYPKTEHGSVIGKNAI